MEISTLKRDSASISAGKWIGDIPGMGDVRFKVRGMSSPIFRAVRSRKERAVPVDDRMRDGSLKPDVAERILGESLHEAVLLDWEGFTDQGKPLAYDATLALEWLTNPDMVSFANGVAYAAQIVDFGRDGVEKGLAKNSERLSGGQSKDEK